MGKQFQAEFKNYPEDQRRVIVDFIAIYQQYGLSDFSKFKGKLTPSWKGVDSCSDNYQYAKANALWHYHIGIPTYQQSLYGDYFTSDWVLHFMWEHKDNHIVIVDVLFHYKADGTFHLPSPKYLDF